MRLYDDLMHVWRQSPETRDAFASSVRFDVSNVADYWHEHYREGLFGDYSNARLPFEKIWLEFNDPGNSFIAGVWLEDLGPDDVGIRVAATLFMKSRGPVEVGTAGFRTDEAGEVIYFPEDEPELKGKKVFVAPLEEFSNAVGAQAASNNMYKWMDISFVALAFMHCRNVGAVDIPPPGTRQQRRAAMRKGVNPAQFKTLIIDPMKQVLHTEGGIEKNGLRKALHICRGHFATYTDDKPLFGKYTGTFWRPAHVRGTADAGTVYKDYKVKAGGAA